jgi:hypothetical protein
MKASDTKKGAFSSQQGSAGAARVHPLIQQGLDWGFSQESVELAFGRLVKEHGANIQKELHQNAFLDALFGSGDSAVAEYNDDADDDLAPGSKDNAGLNGRAPGTLLLATLPSATRAPSPDLVYSSSRW